MTSALCLTCLAESAQPGRDGHAGGGFCGQCGSSRLITHPELFDLTIAHLDCDAFYASIEKRDRPELENEPVIVGGGRRGVVTAACYVARRFGVRSAMPMFQALERCPGATVIRPNMEKYSRAGQQVRELMRGITPLVEPISIDEAFLDVSALAGGDGPSPAAALAGLMQKIEGEVGVTASVGLSYNKFLAKIASDLDKPRGFSPIGRADAIDFLTPKPVRILWGVGPALEKKLTAGGIATVGDLRGVPERELIARYGMIGRRLSRFARGEDTRTVTTHRETKSISSETTFDDALSDLGDLRRKLWPLCERLALRLEKADLSAGHVTLKLKSTDFKIRTRTRAIHHPTKDARQLFEAAALLLEREAVGTRFRLIGIGAHDLVPPGSEPADLFSLEPQDAAR